MDSTNNTNNEVLGKRVLKLQDLLQSMSYYNWDHPHKPGPHWTDRPECSQVLSEYNLWSIHKSYIESDLIDNFISSTNTQQSTDGLFFQEYFKTKLGSTDT